MKLGKCAHSGIHVSYVRVMLMIMMCILYSYKVCSSTHNNCGCMVDASVARTAY